MAMKKKNQKEKQSPVRSFTTSEFGALLESIDKNVKHVSEGHTLLEKKIEGVEERLGGKLDEFRYEVRTEIGFLRLAQSNNSNALKDLSIKTEASFKAAREYLSRIDDEIQELKKIFAGRPELKRVEHLETRLAHVELVVKKYYDKNSD